MCECNDITPSHDYRLFLSYLPILLYIYMDISFSEVHGPALFNCIRLTRVPNPMVMRMSPTSLSMVIRMDPPQLVRTDVSADATNYSTSNSQSVGTKSKYIFLFLKDKAKWTAGCFGSSLRKMSKSGGGDIRTFMLVSRGHTTSGL